MSELKLTGRVAVVTGSARRIGLAIARALAGAGAAVVVNGHSSASATEAVAEALRRDGHKAVACLADVSNPDEVKRLIDSAIDNFGRLDILVNNAAVRRPVPFAEMTLTEWRRVMSTILDGAFLCAHAALPHLIASGHGRIVNIGGVSSHIGSDSRAHVVAAKAGIGGLTRALARECGPHGITVNCVAPGLIEEPEDDPQEREFRRRHVPLASIPLRRSGAPADIGKAVAMICSDDFSYLTGQTIHLNGGVYLS